MLNFVTGGTQYYPLEVSYQKSLSQLGARVDASFYRSDIGGNVEVALGDTVKVYEDWKSYFVGMVTEVTTTEQKLTLRAYDSCYYLNKSKRTIQFSNMTVSEALAELWKQCGIFNHHCPDMAATIDSVCYAETPAQIAKELITAQTDVYGGEYYIVSDSFNSVEVYEVGELTCDVGLCAIISPSYSVSLEGVKNRVSLIVSDGSGYNITETASDNKSINKYGLLAEFVTVSQDASAAVASAQNRLASLSRIIGEGSVTVKGDWALTAVGRRIRVNEPVSGLSGEYVINSVSHKLGDEFLTTLSLREYIKPVSFNPIVEEAKSEELDELSASRGEVKTAALRCYLPYKSRLCRLTSRYGYRTHPVTGQKNSFHGGVDLVGIATDSGDASQIVSLRSGRVVQSRIVTDKNDATWQWGNYVAVLGDDGATIYYCHLASRAASVGQEIKRGALIGIQGSTGQSTGPHLHFEVRRGNERINAAEYLGIPNDPGTYQGLPLEADSSAAAQTIIDRLKQG